MRYQQKTRRALITACAFSTSLVAAAKQLGYHTDEPLSKRLRKEGVRIARIEHQVAVVMVSGKPHAACVHLCRDGTFNFYRNGEWQMRQPTVPADVLAALTPWERRRIAHRLPEGTVA